MNIKNIYCRSNPRNGIVETTLLGKGTVLCLPGMRFSAGYMRASSEGVNCNDLLKKGRTRFITNAAFFYIINYY